MWRNTEFFNVMVNVTIDWLGLAKSRGDCPYGFGWVRSGRVGCSCRSDAAVIVRGGEPMRCVTRLKYCAANKNCVAVQCEVAIGVEAACDRWRNHASTGC